MITLISQWDVRTDISDTEWFELLQNLQAIAATVEAAEPATLVYRVHTQAPDPRNPDPRKKEKPGKSDERKHVTFYEIYECAESFQIHLDGKPFNNFLRDNLKYFKENPERPGYPSTTTTFLHLESGYFRDKVDGQ